MAENEVRIVVTADDKASKTIVAITSLLGDAVNAISNITEEYIAYGDSVKSLSAFTGMELDETSRLIQTADDLFVSYDTLKMGMKKMVSEGVTPSIDGMAKLSDQYLAIQDPLLKSQFLIDNFGRSGMEMAKIMEAGGEQIRSMSQAISDSLIMDEAKYAALEKNKQAVDEFNDALTGIRYEFAGKLLDIFTKLPKPIQDTVLAVGMMSKAGVLDGFANLLVSATSLKNLCPTLVTSLGSVAVSAWAAVAPFLAVAAAIAAVVVMMKKAFDFGYMLAGMLDQLYQKGFFTNFSTFKAGISGLRASGGSVFGGQSYIVGERGPELFTPSGSGMITPNNQLSSGGGTVVINYAPMVSLADRFELETKLTPIIINALRGAV